MKRKQSLCLLWWLFPKVLFGFRGWSKKGCGLGPHPYSGNTSSYYRELSYKYFAHLASFLYEIDARSA